jgi:hypothetical protein
MQSKPRKTGKKKPKTSEFTDTVLDYEINT